MENTNVHGLPDVKGLENLVDPDVGSKLSQDKAVETAAQAPPTPQIQEQETPPQVQESPPPTPDDDKILAQFDTPHKMLKSYKEIQGFATRITQENKQLKEQLQQFQEHLELLKYQQQAPPQQVQRPPQQDFDRLFIENPQQAVATVASQVAQQQMHVAQIAAVLDEEMAKNPGEYQERYSYVQHLARQFPQLANSPQGVRKLFELGDRNRKQVNEKRARDAVRSLFGEDVDVEKLKTLLKGNPQAQQQVMNAYMPDTTSGTTRSDSGKKQRTYEDEIQEGIKKGDPDAVLDAQFRALGLRVQK